MKKFRGLSREYPIRCKKIRENGNKHLTPDICLILYKNRLNEYKKYGGMNQEIFMHVNFTKHKIPVNKLVKITLLKLSELILEGRAIRIVAKNNGSGGYDEEQGEAFNFSINDCTTVVNYL